MVPYVEHPIVAAHRLPVALSDTAIADRDNSVVVRYDGMLRGVTPVIFAVISAHDLAKFDADVLDELQIDGINAVFIETSSVSLYVDSDVHEEFLTSLFDMADEQFLTIENVGSDLRILSGSSGQMEPPVTPAFMENGGLLVPASEALENIATLRADRAAARSIDGLDEDRGFSM